MKNLFILIISLVSTFCYGQNLILNGDFENCDTASLAGTSGCSGLPDGELGELNYVQHWENVKLPPTNARGTVDWWESGSICQYWQSEFSKTCGYNTAQSGSKFIGMFDGEGAQFDFGSNLPIGVYKVVFWAKGNYYNSDATFGVGSSGTWGVSLTINDSKIKLSNQCDLNSGFTIFQTSFPSTDYQDWHKIECFFDTRTQAVRYIVFGALFDRDCVDKHAYIYIDNVTVENTCCSRIMRYQNTSQDTSASLLPRLTQRTDTIIAGDSVSKFPELLTGPVIVRKDSTVRFQAAHCVLMTPGFYAEPGSVFTASIGNCQRDDSTSRDYSISLKYYTGVFGGLTQMQCDYSDTYHCLNFQSIGATHYRVQLLNRLREIFFVAEGEISESFTPYFCGNGASGQSPLSGPIEVVLELFNCANCELYDLQVNIEYDVSHGCSPAAKTSLTEENLVAGVPVYNGILIYPNPVDRILHVKYSTKEPIEDIEIMNNLGQVIFRDRGDSGMLDINVEHWASGIYTCHIKVWGQYLSKKIIINSNY